MDQVSGGSIQKFWENTGFLRAQARPSVLFGNWFRDGTQTFTARDLARTGGHFPADRIAVSYKKLFGDSSPELVEAFQRAFQGQAICETVDIEGKAWDARLIPTYTDGRIDGVVSLLVDAQDRITAYHTVKTVDLLSQIRHKLIRLDSIEEFLSTCCNIIGQVHPAVWIGLAEKDEQKCLRIFTGNSPESQRFAALNLSWDVSRKGGRQPAAEAVSSSKVHVIRDPQDCTHPDFWHEESKGWTGFVALPLQTTGASIGVLVIHGNDYAVFDDEMIWLWEAIAHEITEGIKFLLDKEERAKIVGERQVALQQYRQILDSIFDVTVIHRAGKIVAINPAGVEKARASSADQLIGTPVITLIAPEDRERINSTLEGTEARSELCEFRLLSLNGNSIEVEGITVPWPDEGVGAKLSVWRDISERKRNEEIILRQKHNLEYAQQVSKAGSALMDIASGKAEWTHGAISILGLDPSVQDGSFIDAMLSAVRLEHREPFLHLVSEIRRTAKEQSGEFNLTSGKTIQVHGIPQVEQHVRVQRIFFVVQDISIFRESERELRITAEELRRAQMLGRMGHFQIDLNGPGVVLSSSAADLLEFSALPEVELSLDSLYRQIHSDDQIALRANIEKVLEYAIKPVSQRNGNRAPSCKVDCRLETQSSPRWVHIHVEISSDGTVSGNVQDITDRKQVELDLQATKEKLLETQALARVVEWAYDVKERVVTWGKDVKVFLGYEPKMAKLSYDLFMDSIRAEDRELIRRSVEHTVRYKVPGEMVYVETFPKGEEKKLYGRWRPEFGPDGEVVRLNGLSLDITNVNHTHENELRNQRLHKKSGLPELEMVSDRIHYLATRAISSDMPFSIIGIKIHNYPDIKRYMSDEELYFRTQSEIARLIIRAIPNTDTVGRLGRGCFAVILARPAKADEIGVIEETIASGWERALGQAKSKALEKVSVKTCAVESPQEGVTWEVLLAALDEKLAINKR